MMDSKFTVSSLYCYVYLGGFLSLYNSLAVGLTFSTAVKIKFIIATKLYGKGAIKCVRSE